MSWPVVRRASLRDRVIAHYKHYNVRVGVPQLFLMENVQYLAKFHRLQVKDNRLSDHATMLRAWPDRGGTTF